MSDREDQRTMRFVRPRPVIASKRAIQGAGAGRAAALIVPRRSAPRDGDPARTPVALRTAIGVMSGTSMDGIDVALIESDGEAQLKTGPSATLPGAPAVAQRLCAGGRRPERRAQATQLELEGLATPTPMW